MGIPSLLDKIPRGLFELTSSKHGLARLIKTALNIKLKNKTLKDIESTPHFFPLKSHCGSTCITYRVRTRGQSGSLKCHPAFEV